MIVSRIKSVTGLSRSRAWRLSSVEYAGQKIEVCFLGSEIQKNFVKRALFPGAADEEYLGVQYFHHLRQLFPGGRRYDLIIAEKHSQDQLPRLNGRYWFMPHWISTFTDLPLTRLSNSFRSDLRLIRKNHLKYRITTDPAELRDFYRQMYLPLVSQSHGDSSIPMQLEELIENIEKNLAELLLVCDASNRPISGMVIDYRGNLPNLWSVGVLNGDRDLLTIGAIPACYHFCYEYLEKLGYSRVSLGLCRAFINDGVLRFKRKFGLKILDATDRGFIFFPTRGSAAMEELLKKNAFISSTNGRLQLTTFTGPDGRADELQLSISKKFAESGLFASEIYQVAGSDIVKVSENTFDEASNIEKPRTSTTTTDRDECSRAALYLLRHLMHVRNDRTMLLYADELSHHDTMEVIVSAASKLGLEVECLLLDRAEGLEQQARKIEQRLEEREFDVLLELSGQYFYNTPAWSRARQLGVRTFGLGPLDLKSLLTCVGQVDHHKVYFLAERIRKILLKCSYVHISDSNGTDLTMRMSRPLSNQLLSKIRLIAPRYTAVNRPTGFLSNKVNSTFLGGQLSFLGFLPWTNGTLVVDAYLWPPKEIGCIKKKVTLEIGRGSIIGVDGGKEAELFSRLQPLSERNLEHICIGLNPGANIDRNLMEAERALGACNFGFGRYPHHTDAVISKPTLMADDIPIIDRGEVSRDI